MIFCSWVIVLSPFPVPEGGSRSQFGVRTAPALGTLSKTNNDCQIKFKLSQVTNPPAGAQIGNDTAVVTNSDNLSNLVTTPGFIRVRKRALKDDIWRRCTKTSISFDIVRA